MTFLVPLQLTQRSRIALQLGVSFLLILACVQAFFSTPTILDAMGGAPHTGLKDPPIWTIAVVFVLCLIPAVFVFFLLKREFHFVDDDALDDDPEYRP